MHAPGTGILRSDPLPSRPGEPHRLGAHRFVHEVDGGAELAHGHRWGDRASFTGLAAERVDVAPAVGVAIETEAPLPADRQRAHAEHTVLGLDLPATVMREALAKVPTRLAQDIQCPKAVLRLPADAEHLLPFAGFSKPGDGNVVPAERLLGQLTA